MSHFAASSSGSTFHLRGCHLRARKYADRIRTGLPQVHEGDAEKHPETGPFLLGEIVNKDGDMIKVKLAGSTNTTKTKQLRELLGANEVRRPN